MGKWKWLGRKGSISTVQSSVTLLFSASLILTVSSASIVCKISFYTKILGGHFPPCPLENC